MYVSIPKTVRFIIHTYFVNSNMSKLTKRANCLVRTDGGTDPNYRKASLKKKKKKYGFTNRQSVFGKLVY